MLNAHPPINPIRMNHIFAAMGEKLIAPLKDSTPVEDIMLTTFNSESNGFAQARMDMIIVEAASIPR
jgi:hypothetical protein